METEPELNIIACAIGSVQCTKHFTKKGKAIIQDNLIDRKYK